VNAWTAGIDVGSTYTKAVVMGPDHAVAGRALRPTGFQLARAAEEALAAACGEARLFPADVSYIVATGFGRHQVKIGDVRVTDLTAAARGATLLFPRTRTILDVGGQTMKASRLGDGAKVRSFRLNDKCAAGTGAFLEKTARYMGYGTEEIGPLVATSKTATSISGVCAVFAESEVINHLSQGAAPADIMHGAIVSLVGRSVQLMKRVGMEPEFTLIGGILRFPRMAQVVREQLGAEVNVATGDLVQFTAALGAALLGQQRLRRRAAGAGVAPGGTPGSFDARGDAEPAAPGCAGCDVPALRRFTV
jgi:predicted CoA-substrate-specific enzyme activase